MEALVAQFKFCSHLVWWVFNQLGLVMVGPSENPSIRQKMLEEELRKLKGMVLAELRRFVPIWVLLLVLIGLRLVELGLKCCKDELSWRLQVCQPAAPPTWMVQVRRWQRPLLAANNPRPSSNSLREKSMTSPTSPTPASTSMSAAGTDLATTVSSTGIRIIFDGWAKCCLAERAWQEKKGQQPELWSQ